MNEIPPLTILLSTLTVNILYPPPTRPINNLYNCYNILRAHSKKKNATEIEKVPNDCDLL